MTLFHFDNILLPCELVECLVNMSGVKEVCFVGVPIVVGGVTLPVAVIVRDLNSNLTKYDTFYRITGEKLKA